MEPEVKPSVLVWLLAASLLSAVDTAAGREPDLRADAKALAELHVRQLGAGYVTRIDNKRHLVYVSALDPRTFGRVVQTLARYMDAQRGLLFPDPFLWNVTVVLPTLNDYRKAGPPPDVAGYYRPATRTLASISVSNILIHEFTHALHHSDQVRANQRHPVWISEGLATLFQQSRVHDGQIELLPDVGLAAFQKSIREKKIRTLAALCTVDRQEFTCEAKVNYPHARHVMLYLFRRDKLLEFYRIYKSRYGADPTGANALEATLGKPLQEIETAWRNWVLELQPPWTPAHPLQAHLGIRMGRAPEGVKVDGFLRGAAAQQAGVLKVDDIIISVAGNATPTARELTEAVESCRPGETIDIEIVRDGRTTIVRHVLGAVRRRTSRSPAPGASPSTG